MNIDSNISFAGSGFIGIYHIGVSACLKKFAPHLLQNKIGGSSAGALVAAALACDIPMEDITRQLLMVASQSRKEILGPFNPMFNIHQLCKDILENLLPEDVAQRVSGKLFVSLTMVNKKSNILVSEFNDKADVIGALSASSFVPVMSGFLPPKFRGKFAIDGFYSDNIPDLGGSTITVSPFDGDASIGPSDDNPSSLLLRFHHGSGGSLHLTKENMKRFKKAVLPPDTDKMEKICLKGFKDALKYLISEDLIRCQECFMEYKMESTVKEMCQICIEMKERILNEELPMELVKVFIDIRLQHMDKDERTCC